VEELASSQHKKRKISPVTALLLGGGIILLLGVLAIVGGRGLSLFNKLEMSVPQPTNTMLEPEQKVSDSLKNQGILGTITSIDVSASNFAFTPAEIVVNHGDTVQINFINTQGMHNFTIEGIAAKTKTIQAGSSEQLTFVADKVGSFPFYCSVGNHRAMGMSGVIIVR